MSIYGGRERSAYAGMFDVPSEWADNPHVLGWWTPEHDELIRRAIKTRGFNWPWKITDEIVRATPAAAIEEWKRVDPLCQQYAWYNVLMYYAISRAKATGLLALMGRVETRECPFCGDSFREDSLPGPLVERLGIDNLLWCAPCLTPLVLQHTGNGAASKDDVRTYLRDLAEVIGRVPPQGYGERPGDLHSLSSRRLGAALALFKRKPATARVTRLYGSWFKALVDAGVLEDGARRTARGTQCLAEDGHMCYSLGEKTIDDWLSARKIPHEKEPPYPGTAFRADFLVNGAYVEYFGLAGDPDYDARADAKRRAAEQACIRVVPVYPRDLARRGGLRQSLASILDPAVTGGE